MDEDVQVMTLQHGSKSNLAADSFVKVSVHSHVA
jgi:hypothetical protein